MKKGLSVLLVLLLLLSVGAVGASAMPPFDELERVVLGQPLVVEPDETGWFAWVVEESREFVFTWNSGDFDLHVFTQDGELGGGVSMWETGNQTFGLHLQAGEYTVVLVPFRTTVGDHSVTITQVPTWWQNFVAAIGPLLLGIAIAVVIAGGLFATLWWLGMNH
ncbi:MAG: hypothetical protein FWB76_03910 [Oscillospiraceae bacterium]|nr:hypothetical protein [Oscillospiraceae bacterium]